MDLHNVYLPPSGVHVSYQSLHGEQELVQLLLILSNQHDVIDVTSVLHPVSGCSDLFGLYYDRGWES